MPHNTTVANVFGTLGTVCWTGQLLPQLWKSYREKDTRGLSPFLPLLGGLSGVPLGAYALIQRLNMPLIIQPQLFMVFCIASWAQCVYYGRRRSKGVCIAMFVSVLSIMAGVEIGLVYAVRPAYGRGNTIPITFLGILSSVIIALALLPQYWEIYRIGYVRGLSIPFIAIDCAGGAFNDLSLAWKGGKFDVLAGVCYSIVVVMDGLIVIAALVLNPRAKRMMEAEKAAKEGGAVEEGSATPPPDASAELDPDGRKASVP